LIALLAMGFGITMTLAAINPWTWASPALLVLAGVSMSVCNTSSNSLLQASASPQFRGITVSLFMLAMRGGLALGGVLTGAAASFVGIREALLMDGFLAIVVVAVISRAWLKSPLPNL
jgi:MFS family permease